MFLDAFRKDGFFMAHPNPWFADSMDGVGRSLAGEVGRTSIVVVVVVMLPPGGGTGAPRSHHYDVGSPLFADSGIVQDLLV